MFRSDSSQIVQKLSSLLESRDIRHSQRPQLWSQPSALLYEFTWCRREQEEGRWCGLGSSSRLCSRDGKICCCGDTLSTIFLLACFCALLPAFRFSFFFSFLIFFLHPGMFIFFVSLRLCSSHLLLSASTCFIRSSTCSFCLFVSFVPYPISKFFCFLFVLFFFFVALISRVAFFLWCSRTRYASTRFAYLDSLAFGFSRSQSVTT